MVSRLCDDGVQGRDGRCVENSSCFQIFLFVPVCILLLGSPAGLIYTMGLPVFSWEGVDKYDGPWQRKWLINELPVFPGRVWTNTMGRVRFIK